MAQVTIIIPLYNEAKNLARSIVNLVEQDSQNFHAIFIDDGSTDNSLHILRSLLEEFQPSFTFEILQQNNQGAAQARELGIKHAKTEYVISLDADDRYSQNMISQIEKAILENPDIILPDMQIEDGEGNFTAFTFFKDEVQLNAKECLINSLGEWEVHGCICVKRDLFLKSYQLYQQYNPTRDNFLNNDEVISRLNYFHANTVLRVNATYYYLYNNESSTKSLNLNRYGRCNNAIIMHKIFSSCSEEIDHKAQIELFNTIRHTRRNLKNNKNQISNIKLWRKTIRRAIRYSLINVKSQKLPLKQRFTLLKYYFTL